MFKLAAVFTDNMVLQQAAVVPVWGTAGHGIIVRICFAGQEKSARTNSKGNWQVNLEPLAANSIPQDMIISANDAAHTRLVLRNILVGEVWVCSGQSNMEWPVARSQNQDIEIAGANFTGIRLLTIPRLVAEKPLKEIKAGAWTVCNQETAANFSAVGYFFGRELHRRLDLPVGLINASWGGTAAEAWTSKKSLLENPELAELVPQYERNISNLTELNAKYEKENRLLTQKTRDVKNEGYPRGWADIPAPAGEWNDMELPGVWQSRGLNFSGILWFRKEIELPVEWVGRELRLSIGATDKSDTTYFNNIKVGGVTMADRPDAWSFLRSYTVPANLAGNGKNVIAVRVHSDRFAGGMTGPAVNMNLSCPALPGSPPIRLAGVWKYAIENNYGQINIPPPPPGPNNPNSPSGLFNGMISPLLPFALRGAIWYQGESNANRAVQYQTLFPALIRDWRKHWGRGEFPFLFVQLANYMAEQSGPVETSQWAELREAQTMTLRLPNTGMATTIDIGNAEDIHPQNKQDVGLRLALNALAKVYGRIDVAYSGPMFKTATREGKALRIHFDHVNGGLKCRGEKPLGFAIAGVNRKFVWAQAEIDGNTVLAQATEVSEPQFVRYAWADNPICNLYNGAGLPAVPFRSDMPENKLNTSQ